MAVLLHDKVGVNLYCCEYRMVTAEEHGSVKEVSVGYAQLLREVGCFVYEVRNWKDSRLGRTADHIVFRVYNDLEIFEKAFNLKSAMKTLKKP